MIQHMLNWDWAYNSYNWSSISLSQHNKTEQRKHTIIEVSKGDCIVMGGFNHGNIKWDTLQSIGVDVCV